MGLFFFCMALYVLSSSDSGLIVADGWCMDCGRYTYGREEQGRL